MACSWINDNFERPALDIYELVGFLTMIAGHPWKNLVTAGGPVPAHRRPDAVGQNFHGVLTVRVRSGPSGLIAELEVDEELWFTVRQEEFATASFTAYDWGDYFGMAIESGGERVEISDAYNYGEEHLRRRRRRR